MSKVQILFGKLNFIVLALLLCATEVRAWYDFGHMEIAAIAYQRLHQSTKQRVDYLLQLNPYYPKWSANPGLCPAANNSGLGIFMQAATWPDSIKDDPNYLPDGDDNGHSPLEPIASQNRGYADYWLHKYWHFSDRPFSQDGTALPPACSVNAETQIDVFRKILSDPNASDELKSYDLVWLEHLVGDIHQPMHCATRICKDNIYGDRGGNKVKVLAPTGATTLHGFWDGAAGTDRSLDSALYAARELHKSPKRLSQQLKTATWAKESFDLAKSAVYTKPIGAGLGPFTPTERYRRQATRIANQRIRLAGERLASILNKELK